MKVDIFGLGTLFYFVLSKGTHPFGNRFKRNGNIVDGVFELDQVAPHPACARTLQLEWRRRRRQQLPLLRGMRAQTQ